MSARPLTGRVVFTWIAAGFGLVIAVNGAFTYFALKSWTGLTSANAYNEGIAYNRTLDRVAAQAQLKWRAEMGWSDGAAELRLYDRDGKPVQGLSVVATFARPVQEGFDRSAALTEAQPGRYFATVTLPLPGQWNMTIETRHGAANYRAAARVFVP